MRRHVFVFTLCRLYNWVWASLFLIGIAIKTFSLDVVMRVKNFAPLLWGDFHFSVGVVCRNYTFVWSAQFPQQSSHPCVFASHVLCSCSVVSYITRWSNTDLFLTLSQQAVTRPRVSASSLILWHQLRQLTSKTAAFHMLEDVIQRCRWWVITSRTWECLYGTRLVALGGRRREWLRVRMEENGEGCVVTFCSLG